MWCGVRWMVDAMWCNEGVGELVVWFRKRVYCYVVMCLCVTWCVVVVLCVVLVLFSSKET